MYRARRFMTPLGGAKGTGWTVNGCAVTAACTTYGCRPPRGDVGVVPYIMRELRNYATIIPYVIVGPTHRAWFIPPTTDGETVKVRLESVPMNLGCDGSPPRAQVQTMVVGRGGALPQNSPVTFAMPGVSSTFHIGCSEDSAGKWTFRLGSCVGGPVTDSWIVLNTNNVFQSYLMTGTTCTARTRDSARVLRALPTALDPTVFELAWRSPASNEGVNATMLFLFPGVA